MESIAMMQEYSVSQTEAARLLRVNVRTLRNWRQSNGGPPYLKVGKKFWYSTKRIEQWLRSRITE